MKTMILIAVLLLSKNSFAAYNRLWVGYKKTNVVTPVFLSGLNKTFFRETIEVGSGKGLLAYQPYISKMHNGMPDEVALVSYESEEKYKAIRSTPAGEQYSELHWTLFEKEKSKSTVSQPFKGVLSEGAAVELTPAFTKWQSGSTFVAIYARTPQTDLKLLAKAFKDLELDKEVNNSILLIGQMWIIEYRSKKNGSTSFAKLPLNLAEVNILQDSALRALPAPVQSGNGVNFLF